MVSTRHVVTLGTILITCALWNLQHSSTVVERPSEDVALSSPGSEAMPLIAEEATAPEVASNPTPTTIATFTGGWKPRAMAYSGNIFGSRLEPPITSAADPWCETELLGTLVNPPTHRYDPTCPAEPLKQGNFSRISDLMQFRLFPRTSPVSYIDVTAEERALYWQDNSDPYIADCKACQGSLVHKTLYRARRWWRIRSWKRRESSSDAWVRIRGSFLGAHESHFSTRRGSISTSGFDLEPFDESTDTALRFADIAAIRLCVAKDDAYAELILKEGGQIVLQPQMFRTGIFCFWRTLQLLFPDTLATIVRELPPLTCSFSSTTVAADSQDLPLMKRDLEFPFTPCYRNDITNLSVVIASRGTMGTRKNFWPFTCDAMRNTDGCGQKTRVAQWSRGVSQDVRVAVALSGFVRSFASAKAFIYDNIVRPHKATLFGSTWNVVGRTKKTVVVTKKMAVRPIIMFNTIAPYMGVSINDTFKRLEVNDYFRFFRQHEAIKANGFLHPGLYYTMVRSLTLVYESSIPFDIVIRTRFDVYASVPLQFIRIRSTDVDVAAPGSSREEFVLDVGSSCLMDGMWWPQYVRFGDGRVLKHYADTRMKYFSWQVCDWIDIGTYGTMKTLTGIFDWIVENNVHSAAQFVDHAFFLDRNISYLPMQLYLKLVRHKTTLFG